MRTYPEVCNLSRCTAIGVGPAANSKDYSRTLNLSLSNSALRFLLMQGEMTKKILILLKSSETFQVSSLELG